MNAEKIQAFKDKREILDCIYRYSRGIDRMDTKLLKSVYHPDATDDHGIFTGNAWEFAEYMASVDENLGVSAQSHSIDNVIIELTGRDTAVSEAYHIASFRADTADGTFFTTVGGRYLDKFERRNGEWKIADRVYVMDWNMNGPSTEDMTSEITNTVLRGKLSMKDDSYNFLPVGSFNE
jgi:hypothetical protein